MIIKIKVGYIMNKSSVVISFVVLLFAIFAYRFFNTHSDLKQAPSYVGSDSCKSCHEIQFQSLNQNTLHPKIFLPITSQSQILGDFDQNNPLVTFKKEDVTYVVGSKWEQVYMRMIDGEYYPFTAKWMVTTNKWVPYKVHKWKETPASIKCNGCHTTGYNPMTHGFKEFGVNCESCHGGGSLHVKHQEMSVNAECVACHNKPHVGDPDILVSTKSTVCGQCHSRGKSVVGVKDSNMTVFNFPLNYKIGGDINSTFVATTLKTDKKGKNWWGNGVSKNRHQEFADFSFSGHAKTLENLRNKKNPHGGETSDKCLTCHSQDYRSAKDEEKPTLKTAKEGITCVTCHEPHGMDRNVRGNVGANRCSECHVNILATTIHDKKKPQKHFPCPVEEVTCADCHMPRIVKTGGDFTIRSHAFRIIPPSASIEHKMPNSCQNSGCHSDKTYDEMNTVFKKEYPNFNYNALRKALEGEPIK